MCNLYRLDKAPAEIAKLFRVPNVPGLNFAHEVYPGYTGLVIAGGQMRTMTWGFPLARKGRDCRQLKPKPVTNAREDKLRTTFWRDSFVHLRADLARWLWVA